MSASYRLKLLGHIDDAKTPFADLFKELVGANPAAGAFERPIDGVGWGRSKTLEKPGRALLGLE